MKSFATATVLSLAATTQVVFAYNSRTPIRGRLGVNQYWSPNPSEFAYGLPGRIAPVPEGFDPFGYANRADVQQMKNYREAELQHGRVAMLATLGYLVTEKPVEFHPLFGTNGQDIGPAIRHLDKVREVSPEFFGFLAIAIGGFELNRALIGWEEPGNVFASGRTLKESYFPGDGTWYDCDVWL